MVGDRVRPPILCTTEGETPRAFLGSLYMSWRECSADPWTPTSQLGSKHIHVIHQDRQEMALSPTTINEILSFPAEII
uniref:Uncharacterized protein n=1 Tax=Engystomops pustulosus TaxID=76066 RepID=A0AAV6YP02_ENGPU|nr:hypothetical protein GDO81_022760 [Engystomops pustulosus]